MYLGLDLGTTNIKALAVDESGKVVAVSSCPVDIYYLPDGAVEQDIENIWTGVLTVLKEIAAKVDGKKIKAIGISSQGGAMQILDSRQRPLGKVISWLDGRGAPYNQALTKKLGADWFIRHLGHPQANVTIGHILRLKEQKQLPADYSIGYVGDVIVQRLCGVRAHDHTSLSIALLYNPYQRKPCQQILQELGIAESCLPVLLPPFQKAGGLLKDVACQTGLAAEMPVSAAVHDQYAAALGCGAFHDGDVMLGTGTAWVLLAVSCQMMLPVGPTCLVCNHLIEGVFGQIMSMVNGGSALSWVLRLLDIQASSVEHIDRIVQTVKADIDNPIFFPLFAGDHCDAKILGLKLSHSKAHLVRSVIEGLAFELNRHIEMLVNAGIPVKKLIMTGKAAQSAVTPQIVANVIQKPILCAKEPDVSAFGAAIIAKALADKTADITKSVLQDAKMFMPDGQTDIYEKRFKRYLENMQHQKGYL